MKQTAKTFSYARYHEEWLEAHPDIKREFTGLLKNIDSRITSIDLNKLQPAAEQPETRQPNRNVFQIPKQRVGESKFAFIDDLLHFALKPEYAS